MSISQKYPKKKNIILYCGLRLPSHSYIMKSVINGERYSVQKLTIHLFIPYLLYMSGSQRAVLIQKGDCSRIKNEKKDTDDYLLTKTRQTFNNFIQKWGCRLIAKFRHPQ